MTDPSDTAPQLAPPGAGIPTLQRLVFKYWVLPRFMRSISWEAARALFRREADKIFSATRGLSDARFFERALVPPMRGLEDSSRYWSVAMTLEHLEIVGDGMIDAISQLTHGKSPDLSIRTADLKPQASKSGNRQEALERFERLVRRFEEMSREAETKGDIRSRLTQRHPWFGPMNAQEWHVLAGIHQNLHRKQIQAIIERVGERIGEPEKAGA